MAADLCLAFDTSAAHCAAALLSGDVVLAERFEAMDKGQAERLMPMLEEMLAGAGVGWRDLGVIGVGIGPGNFTGVRISVSAARGLALGLGNRAVGVSGLEAMAFGRDLALCSLDARRGEVYVQAFGGEGFGPVLSGLSDPLPVEVPAGLPCLGDHAAHYAVRVGGQVAVPLFPPAVAMARVALARRGGTGRPAPLYLRGADAAPPREPAPVLLP